MSVLSERIQLVHPNEVATTAPEPGLARQVLAANPKMTLVRHALQAGWTGAPHSHPHEQLVFVLRGAIEFTAGSQTFIARTGDSFIVPGNQQHQARAFEYSEVLDVFTPAREDYANPSNQGS